MLHEPESHVSIPYCNGEAMKLKQKHNHVSLSPERDVQLC